MKKLIFVCSPYRGDVEKNTKRAREYCHYVCSIGHVPYAPHLHNTQFLDDNDPDERKTGINLGLEVLSRCDELWVFGGIVSSGMEGEITKAKQEGVQVKYIGEEVNSDAD